MAKLLLQTPTQTAFEHNSSQEILLAPWVGPKKSTLENISRKQENVILILNKQNKTCPAYLCGLLSLFVLQGKGIGWGEALKKIFFYCDF